MQHSTTELHLLYCMHPDLHSRKCWLDLLGKSIRKLIALLMHKEWTGGNDQIQLKVLN